MHSRNNHLSDAIAAQDFDTLDAHATLDAHTVSNVVIDADDANDFTDASDIHSAELAWLFL